MRKNAESSDTVPWVDVFSKQYFQGRLVRLHARSRTGTEYVKGKGLSRISSIIVGPGAIAEVKWRGESGCKRLLQRTVLPDASHLTNGKGFHIIRITLATQ